MYYYRRRSSTKIADLSEDQLEKVRTEVGKYIVEGDQEGKSQPI